MPDDPYDRYRDVSSTPFLDLLVNLLLVVSICGGGLGAIYAAGYFAEGKDSQAWPLTAVVIVLIAVNVGLRVIRARVRAKS
jgi:hypothetical protein